MLFTLFLVHLLFLSNTRTHTHTRTHARTHKTHTHTQNTHSRAPLTYSSSLSNFPQSLSGLSPFQVRNSFETDFRDAVRKLDGLVLPPVSASFPPAHCGDGVSHLAQLQAQMQNDAMRKKRQKEVQLSLSLLPTSHISYIPSSHTCNFLLKVRF